MQDSSSVQMKIRTGRKANLWLALVAALCVHIVIILLPVERTHEVSAPADAQIELELIASSEPVEEEPEPIPPTVETEPEIETFEEVDPEPVKQVVEQTPMPRPAEPQSPELIPVPPIRNPGRSLDALSEPEKSKLTNAILTRQYITEESEADRIFGRPVVQPTPAVQRDFHYPVRQSMISMLDQPLPDVPFAYTPDLVHFAYDPGVRGDLQRFWDVITPEWGFRTKYGTEVRCIWVLIFAGCAWK